MSSVIEVKVPDIGDFKDVPVIEVLVKPGDSVKKEDSLITLESDKATMEVPSPEAGVVKEIKVKLGDKVSAGHADPDAGSRRRQPRKAPAASPKRPRRSAEAAAPAPHAAAAGCAGCASARPRCQQGDFHAEVMVLGSGPGGYTAAFRAADLGKKVVLIERYADLGGVCLNVGCIPSKALLHAARVVVGGRGDVALRAQVRQAEDRSRRAARLEGERRGERHQGSGRARQAAQSAGGHRRRRSSPRRTWSKWRPRRARRPSRSMPASSPPARRSRRIPGFPYDDERLLDSTSALELKDIPKRLLVIGGGIIGLEMATVYDALGSKITVVELLDGLIPGADRDIIRPLHKRIEKRYEGDLPQDQGHQDRGDARKG